MSVISYEKIFKIDKKKIDKKKYSHFFFGINFLNFLNIQQYPLFQTLIFSS